MSRSIRLIFFSRIRSSNKGFSGVVRHKYSSCQLSNQPSIHLAASNTIIDHHHHQLQRFSSTHPTKVLTELTSTQFEHICEETLESLVEQFENIFDSATFLQRKCDISYSSGVITIKLDNDLGTYVINRQTPNKQIWLSSPISGPKRYDYRDGEWIYKHDNISLHELLKKEFSQMFPDTSQLFDFKKNLHGEKQ